MFENATHLSTKYIWFVKEWEMWYKKSCTRKGSESFICEDNSTRGNSSAPFKYIYQPMLFRGKTIYVILPYSLSAFSHSIYISTHCKTTL